jgi:AcrR family transcriptional regulator
VRAATRLLHQQGLQRTTLADVAEAADVPLGNVYYYFKTKDALAGAVLESHEAALRAQFVRWASEHADPRKRLQRLVLAPLDAADSIVEHGCPHGSLCQELSKLTARTPLEKAAARLLGTYVDWTAEQFRALGRGSRESRELAAELIATIQGTMLLAHAMRSKQLLADQLRRLDRTLESLIKKPGQRRAS